jgi:hypothetical protein
MASTLRLLLLEKEKRRRQKESQAEVVDQGGPVAITEEVPQGLDVDALTPQAPATTPLEAGERQFQEEIAPVHESVQAGVADRQRRRETAQLDPKTGLPLPGEGLTTLEKAEDIVFTPEVVDDPEAGVFTKGLAAMGLTLRATGAAAGQGEITDPKTKLLRPLADNLEEWGKSREAQNTSADQMIGSLNEAVREAILSGDTPVEDIEKMTATIDRLEEQKNSGALTTAIELVDGLLIDIGSDPLSWPTILTSMFRAPGAILKRVGESKGALDVVKKATGKTSDKLKKIGIRNNKMLEFIDEQPGATVREKLKNMKQRQPGELTPSGEVQAESVEALFDERTLRSLDENADVIQRELDALKSTQKEVTEGVIEKGRGRKQGTEEARRGQEFDIDTQAGIETLEAQKAGEKLKGAVREGAEKDIQAIPSSVDVSETVGEFTKGGKFSGRGIDEAFNEAESLAKSGKIDIPTRKKLIGEMVASAEGDADRVVDYSEVVNALNKIRKDAPVADYRRALKAQDIDPAFAESFRRLKQGTSNDVIAAKRQFNKVLAKEGVGVDDTMKAAADNFKAEADKVVKSSLGAEGYAKLLKAQEAGGKSSSARKKLLKAMKLDPRKTEIVEDIDFNDAISNLDGFIDDAAKKFAKDGAHPDMLEGGRFPEWKKHFGIDVESEVRNRAKKLSIGEKAVATEKGVEAVTKEAVGNIKVDATKAKSALSRATGDINKKIDGYVRQSKKQLQKGFTRRANEIKEALNVAKKEAGLKANVAEDFRKEVEYFAGEGGFSKNTESFKTFTDKYGEKLSSMIEDQAIFSTFDVSSKGKIANFDKTIDAFRGMRLPSKALQATAFAEQGLNKVMSKVWPYASRLNSLISKTKTKNKELGKQLNRIKKKGGDVNEAIKYLLEKQPLITLDDLASEFKFIEPFSFIDKAFVTSVANSTGSEYTNKQRSAAKRMLQKGK